MTENHAHHHHQPEGVDQSPEPVQHEAMDKAAHGHDIKHQHAQNAQTETEIDHAAMGHEQMFRRRFWVSLLLSIPVLLYNQMVQQFQGFSMPAFPGSQ